MSSIISKWQPAFIESTHSSDGSVTVALHTMHTSLFPMEENPKHIQTYYSKIYSQSFYMRLHGGIKTQAEVATLINGYINCKKQNDMSIGFEVFATDGPQTIRSDVLFNQHFKGVISLNHGLQPGHAHLFWAFKDDAWKSGVAQEAIRAIVDDYINWAREKKYQVNSSPITDLEALVESDSDHAIKALTSVGMKEKTTSDHHRHFLLHFDAKV